MKPLKVILIKAEFPLSRWDTMPKKRKGREAICFRSKYYGRHFLTAFAHKDLADEYLFIKHFSEAKKKLHGSN